MKRTTYPIHPDFKKWENINPPLNPLLIKPLQWLIGLLFHQQKSDDLIDVQKVKISTFDHKIITALRYIPKGIKENAPCLVYCHGGGYVLPAAPHHFLLARRYALEVECQVLLIGYRLAPRYRFPIAPRDCFAGYEWVLDHAKELSIDPTRIGVGGDSAGGCLASIISQMAKDHILEDKTIKMPCLQLLIYPATGVNQASESMDKYVDTPLCNTQDMKKYAKYYSSLEIHNYPFYYEPIHAPSFTDLPVSYVETAEFDCLRDHGIFYAKKLERDGVNVVLNNTVGTIHGFDIELKSEIVKECIRRRVSFLRKYFSIDRP
ncbi:MAG: alpha/beta hydrolase [Bacilli bacterium]